MPPADVTLRCDPRQIARAVTNVLKNAAESIEGRKSAEGETLPPGNVRITLRSEPAGGAAAQVRVDFEDNGPGWPAEYRDRLTEPYVTTRAKGTGLGLAIVKKIIEDHNGDLILADAADGGARVTLVFSVLNEPRDTARTEANALETATEVRAHG